MRTTATVVQVDIPNNGYTRVVVDAGPLHGTITYRFSGMGRRDCFLISAGSDTHGDVTSHREAYQAARWAAALAFEAAEKRRASRRLGR